MPKLTAPPRRLPALLAGIALLAAGCGHGRAHGPAAPAVPATTPAAPVAPKPAAPKPSTATGALALWATTDVSVWAHPRDHSPIALFPFHVYAGQATSFLVRKAQPGSPAWYQVLLPHRPNGSTGWVRGDQVAPRQIPYRVDVDLSARRVTVLRDGKPVARYAAAVGKPATPTPTGLFFVTIKLHPPEISPVYGAWALGLSGYSTVLSQFGTGDGQIALHGTANPAELGRAVSHGCVRLANGVITGLARALPLGTPVDVHA